LAGLYAGLFGFIVKQSRHDGIGMERFLFERRAYLSRHSPALRIAAFLIMRCLIGLNAGIF
jgi:hypothetical protein